MTPTATSSPSALLRILAVADAAALGDFIAVPRSIFASDPAWIEPLSAERRLHLSARNWGGTYAEMLDRMLAAMIGSRERFVAALGERQFRRMLLRMKAARTSPCFGWLFVLRSWLI